MKRIFLLLAPLVSLVSGPAAAGDDDIGLLLLDVQVQLVNDVDHDPGPGGGWTDAYWVRNLATGKSYGGLTMHGIAILDVPAGIYCVDTMRTGNNVHLGLNYCGEPYFRVVGGGRLNNAGRWRFGYRLKTGDFRLFASTEAPDKVLERAKQLIPERFITEGK